MMMMKMTAAVFTAASHICEEKKKLWVSFCFVFLCSLVYLPWALSNPLYSQPYISKFQKWSLTSLLCKSKSLPFIPLPHLRPHCHFLLCKWYIVRGLSLLLNWSTRFMIYFCIFYIIISFLYIVSDQQIFVNNYKYVFHEWNSRDEVALM